MKAQEHKSPRRRLSAATAANEAAVNAPDEAEYQVKVALAAYFIAEKRGFEPGHELDDWLAAEAEIVKPVRLSTVGAQHEDR